MLQIGWVWFLLVFLVLAALVSGAAQTYERFFPFTVEPPTIPYSLELERRAMRLRSDMRIKESDLRLRQRCRRAAAQFQC